jgi:hypothetical protein
VGNLLEIGVLNETSNFLHLIWNPPLDFPSDLVDSIQTNLVTAFSHLEFYYQNEGRVANSPPNFWDTCALECQTMEIEGAIRVQIGIMRDFGSFKPFQTIMTGFLGRDNALLMVNSGLTDGVTVPPGFKDECLQQESFVYAFGLFKDAITQWLAINSIEEFIVITGTHHCQFNCGDCCDGIGHTTTALGDGQYCPYLLDVGRYCLFYLANVPLDPQNQICKEYYCGDIPRNSGEDTKLKGFYGTTSKMFVPEYPPDTREEFFNVLRKVLLHGVSPQDAVQGTAKWSEINAYYTPASLNFLSALDVEHLLAPLYEKILTLLRWNQIPEILGVLDNAPEIKSILSEAFRKALDALTTWWDMFESRRTRQAENAVHFPD